MRYRYDKNSLEFSKDNKSIFIYILISLTLVVVSYFVGKYSHKPSEIVELEKELIIIKNECHTTPFYRDTLISELKRLNVNFPHIVLAQSIVETGHWTSTIFIENNNLFGMKEASIRIHTSIGTQRGHAYYRDWKESLYDYCFYQSRYLSKLKTEEEYFNYLSRSYAEADNYISSLKRVIKKEKLKELFND